MDWSKWGMEAKVLLNGLVRAGWGGADGPVLQLFDQAVVQTALFHVCVYVHLLNCLFLFDSPALMQANCCSKHFQIYCLLLWVWDWERETVVLKNTFTSQSWKHVSLPWHCNARKSVDSESNYFPRKVSLKASYLWPQRITILSSTDQDASVFHGIYIQEVLARTAPRWHFVFLAQRLTI